MTPFQWLFGPLFLASSVVCLLRMLGGRMSRRAGTAWSLVWAAAAATVIVPKWSTMVARVFGIGRGADFVLYVSVILGLYVALALYHRHRRLEAIVTELVRQRALEERAAGHGGPEPGSAAEPAAAVSPAAARGSPPTELLAEFLRLYPFQPATAFFRWFEVGAILFQPLPGGLGLDLGCGDGKLSQVVASRAGWALVGLGVIPSALLGKELSFKRKFIPDLADGITKLVVSVSLALLGSGAVSMVMGNVINTLAATIVLWIVWKSSWRPSLKIDWSL